MKVKIKRTINIYYIKCINGITAKIEFAIFFQKS